MTVRMNRHENHFRLFNFSRFTGHLSAMPGPRSSARRTSTRRTTEELASSLQGKSKEKS